MTVTSDKIEKLLSYAWNDWMVTDTESKKVAALLEADPGIDQTIADMDAGGTFKRLFTRIIGGAVLRRIVAAMARRSRLGTARARSAIVTYKPQNGGLLVTHSYSGFQVERFFDIVNHLSQSAARHGFSQRLATAAAPAGASTDPAAPFSGVGATGKNPTDLSIGPIDQIQLFRKDSATVARYSNPIPGSLTAYISSLTPAQRMAQALTLTRQPISTVFPEVYASQPPLRSRVMWAAGKLYSLEPELIAGFILAEQRDQSRNEDAKDYVGATSMAKANTSIGLGQVVISTAQRNDLFRDLLPAHVRSTLSHNEIATLLACDEFNIFASARYIRQVADEGATKSIGTLPITQATFPGINMPKYSGHSSTWPNDNLQALASEYTSRAWDDNLSPGWPYFVNEAYKNVKSAGISFP